MRLLRFIVIPMLLTGLFSAPGEAAPTRSTNIDLVAGGDKLVLINREADSVSLFRVRVRGRDLFRKIGEVSVGQDPRYLCARPGTSDVWVTNSASGSVTTVDVRGFPRIKREIPVGTEPRGCAFTPNGKFLVIALRTEGRVVVIDPESGTVVREAAVGGQPEAVAITDDGDTDDLDEWAYVTQFFAEPILGGPGEGFDDGRQGVVQVVSVNTGQVTRRTLAPALSGFTADRTAFCPQFNAGAHSDVFCPDANENDPASATITNDPQFAFPNQLHSLLLRGSEAFVVSIAAQPEPPVVFNNNVQAFVSVLDLAKSKESSGRLTKLNDQIKTESQPSDPAGSLDRLFANDIVALDADPQGEEFLFVSRGGNYVIRARNSGSGPLDIGAPDNVTRIPTGNIPTGVVISEDGDRAYVNNEVGHSFTAIDLDANEVIEEVASSTAPAPGTPEHRALIGQLAFFTALGVGNDDLLSTPIREIDPLEHRNKASDNGWSSCASCHPDGLSDSVTWIFATGPRQSVPMDGSWGSTPDDQRIFNWSGVRSNVRDFNNNARNVQGGEGFADDPGSIFNHGLSHELSDALDLMTFWLQSQVRTPNMPATGGDLETGRDVFRENCASCHGGDKFTKSNLAFRNNPTFDANPLAGGNALDPALDHQGPQLVSLLVSGDSLTFLDDIGTFDSSDPVEIRGIGAVGATALGGLGFNAPSLRGVGSSAPYFHNGSARTLADVFSQHQLPGIAGGAISDTLSTTELQALLAFLEQLDGRTQPVASSAEEFRATLIGQ